MDRIVAIKVLPTHLTVDHPERRKRGLSEKPGLAASLNHPQLSARSTDIGTSQDDTDYLVMEFLEGETPPRSASRKGALPLG